MKTIFAVALIPLTLAITPLSMAGTTPKASATIMFYLDNQNGDYVDSYIKNQLEVIKNLSQKNNTVRWVTLHEKGSALSTGQRSLDIKDQNLTVNEWINGSEVLLADIKVEQKNLRPSFSNPEVLKYFLEKGLSLGSKHNILVMADHGVGSYGLMTTSLTENGKALNEVMSNREAAAAIAGAMKNTHAQIDLIIFDACLMANIEAVTDYRKAGLEMPVVASEDTTTPTSGSLNYEKTIGALAKELEKGRLFDSLLFGAMIVKQSKNNNAINISLINLKVLTDDILNKLSHLFADLTTDLKEPDKNKVYSEFLEARIVDDKTMGVDNEVDLRTYLEMLQKIKVLSKEVKESALELETALFSKTVAPDNSKLVVVSENDQSDVTSEKGLSIVHPIKPDMHEAETVKFFINDCKHSESLLFSSLTGWTEVLKAYVEFKTCDGQ